MLTLEIELLTGVYRASLPDGTGAEWPPHPERVFSALVQAWSDGGHRAEERMALEWLERQGLPVVEASPHISERCAPTVFVPPNDAGGGELAVLPERRPRQARAFRAAVPEDPLVRLHWSDPPEPELRASLRDVARRVVSLGHSSSLARMEFREDGEIRADAAWTPDPVGGHVLRAPYLGRLADLETWFSVDGGKRVERPRSVRPERYRSPLEPLPATPPEQTVFGGPSDWFVFEDVGGSAGFRPDVLAFAHVARRMREALMSLGPQPSPEILSGHGPRGGPSSKPHTAMFPLANVGWEHATGDLLGFAVVVPRAASAGDREFVLRALARFVSVGADRTTGRLLLGGDRAWSVERTASPSRSSLRPERWCARATTWASATPVFLDRFPTHGDAVEEAEIVAAACRNVGLPDPIEVEIHKHSAVAGAPSAYPARGRRSAIDWNVPHGASFRDRPRRHVVLRFERLVEGPVALGAGRYHGLGLCLPLERGANG